MEIKPMADENPFNSLTINLTNRCNILCCYCFQNSGLSGNDLIRIKDIQKVLDFFAVMGKNGKKYLQLTGGEIFLHPDIFEIIRLGLSFGYTLRLQTNGILLNDLDENSMNILADKRVLIKVSLDGWNKETHEKWRAKNTFDKVISGINRLRGYTNTKRSQKGSSTEKS